MTLRIVLAAAVGFAGPLAAQRPRITQAPRAVDLVGSIVPVAGDEKRWSIYVENRSQMDVAGDVTAEFYRPGQQVATKVFNGIPRNGRRLFGTLTCGLFGTGGMPVPAGQGAGPTCPWPVGYECTDSRIVVDAANAVGESNESNNKLEFCWAPQTTYFQPAP